MNKLSVIVFVLLVLHLDVYSYWYVTNPTKRTLVVSTNPNDIQGIDKGELMEGGWPVVPGACLKGHGKKSITACIGEKGANRSQLCTEHSLRKTNSIAGDQIWQYKGYDAGWADIGLSTQEDECPEGVVPWIM